MMFRKLTSASVNEVFVRNIDMGEEVVTQGGWEGIQWDVGVCRGS